MTQHLDSTLKVACEIWHYNQINEPIHFTKLAESMAKHMDKATVSHALDTLEDWMIIYGEYGPTEKGRAGRVWYVDTHDDGDFRIRDLYEKYWRVERMSETPLKLFPRQMTVIKVVDWSTLDNHEEFMKFVIKTGKLPLRVVVLPKANVKRVRLILRRDNCQ